MQPSQQSSSDSHDSRSQPSSSVSIHPRHPSSTSSELHRLRSLWTAVVLQALKDADGPRTYFRHDGDGKRRVNNPHRPDARQAIFDGRLDGACHIVGVPPSALREYARRRGWDEAVDEGRQTSDDNRGTTDGNRGTTDAGQETIERDV